MLVLKTFILTPMCLTSFLVFTMSAKINLSQTFSMNRWNKTGWRNKFMENTSKHNFAELFFTFGCTYVIAQFCSKNIKHSAAADALLRWEWKKIEQRKTLPNSFMTMNVKFMCCTKTFILLTEIRTKKFISNLFLYSSRRENFVSKK